jgi:lysylphosphatidylglycerol synthetase-like protein (DUF2156 family)
MPTLFRTFSTLLERRTVHLPERDLPIPERWTHLRRHGDFPLAYPAVTESYLSTFGDARGMITYAQKMGFTFALGDPVAAPDARNALSDEFIEAFVDPVFVACQRSTAEHLAARGYRVNIIGHDSVIDLPGHSFKGGSHKRIRYATSWLESKGGSVVEDHGGAVSNLDIRTMSGEWRKTRVTPRELLFLNRRFSVKPEEDVRRFYALSSDCTPMGYISFDPVYSEERIVGYLASQKRRRPEETAYLDLAIMRQAIDTFRTEGREAVYLGISPIADIEASGFGRELRWLRHALRRAHTSDWVNTRYFNSRGLAEYKNRFRGRRVPLYLCLPPRGAGVLSVLALLVLIQVV